MKFLETVATTLTRHMVVGLESLHADHCLGARHSLQGMTLWGKKLKNELNGKRFANIQKKIRCLQAGPSAGTTHAQPQRMQ